MSDTLLPPRPADNATMPCDRESSPEIIEIDNPGLPAPPNGASLPRRSTANPIRPLISSKEDDDTDVLPRAIPNNAPARSVREANPEVLENGPNQATPLTDALQPQRSAAGPFRPSALSINSMHAEMLPPTGLEYTQNGREASIDIMDIDHPNQPAPPAQHSTADPSRPPASREKANDVNMLPSPKPLPLPLPRRSSLKATRTTHSLQPDAGQVDDNNPAPAPPAVDLLQLIPNTSPPPLSAEEAELERGALAFLRNYIRLFDRDRTALVRAYSHVATFSVTTHDPSRPASLPSPRALARRLRQGRTDLLGGLLLLPAGRKFLPEGPRGVKYDVVCLGAENKLEVLLMCYVEETKDEDGLVWACDQRFVLRKKEWDDVDRSTGGLWPLVAVSHQMTIREKIPELPRPTAL
ncbi:uncharacterized protein C8Q71DRAFT_472547 [Rhodofomes roseus]|uniref:Nuclear transport factor 2 domain-containing protein n=1 Tax=Rhodofomes roseus TaxID=34475 RepID=A0ABQ8KQ00_9APHY|nr:uncharacterized protein C8Q71DRAFT_472547 [Rhodofomes roseus]KAH9839991.1 hypothetical protein C8Q71DRAFT_472547 [Rhodofomes roseus]